MLQKVSVEIPISKVSFRRGHKLQWQRRLFQAFFITALVVIPLSGLFRIDPLAGAFVVLDRQIWFADFFLVFGLWMILASLLVILYSLIGTAFCGWACPQNTLAEWANYLTRKLLGHKAKVSLEGEALQVAVRKNTSLNWFYLAAAMLAVSMLFALLPLIYFYTPQQLQSFLLLRPDPVVSGSWYWIYTVFVLIVFLDTAFIRHFWCRFICIYKVWQHTFKTAQTLRLHYDSRRSADCEKCSYCQQACFLDLDPRQASVYDSCINCGACIVACDKIHAKQGGKGLLSLRFGAQDDSGRLRWLQGRLTSLFARVHWTFPIFALGGGFFLWGLLSYSPVHASMYRADGDQSSGIHRYTVHIANKLYHEAIAAIRVEGLNAQQYRLEKSRWALPPAARVSVPLEIATDMAPGVYRFQVYVTDTAGNETKLLAVHVVGKDHG